MKLYKVRHIISMLLLMLMFTSCEVVEGIFKTGMGVGIFLVSAVVIVIVIIIIRSRKP